MAVMIFVVDAMRPHLVGVVLVQHLAGRRVDDDGRR